MSEPVEFVGFEDLTPEQWEAADRYIEDNWAEAVEGLFERPALIAAVEEYAESRDKADAFRMFAHLDEYLDELLGIDDERLEAVGYRMSTIVFAIVNEMSRKAASEVH